MFTLGAVRALMIIKIVTLFLIAMMVLAMFGRLRFPGKPKERRPTKCPKCGCPIIGKGPCACGASMK